MIIAYGLFALLAGGVITFSSTLNAQLGKNIGTYKAALYHNGMGALLATTIAILTFGKLASGLKSLEQVPMYLYSGGLVTVAVVVSTIKLVPKIPIIYTTLSVFIGQFFVGFIIDWYMGIKFSLGRMLGFLLIFLGLALNIYLEVQKHRNN